MSPAAAATVKDRPYYVYEARADSGAVLYVGMTAHFGVRMTAHLYLSEWAPQAQTITLTRHVSEHGARAAEADAIRRLRPPYNQDHNPDASSPKRWETRRQRMAAEHAANPECRYHRHGCKPCADELNMVLG